MSNDLQKYENWRAITEADYVTMFIKTWFTYISVLRNTFPDVDVFTEDGKARGDKPFLNLFKTEVLPFVREKIKVESFNKIIFETYPYCIKKVFKTFPQYFFQTFYRYNEGYHYHDEEKTDNNIWILDLKIVDKSKLKFDLLIYIKFRDKSYTEKVETRLDLKQIIDDVNSKIGAESFDEILYLKALYNAVCDDINKKLLSKIDLVLENEKYSDSVKIKFRQGYEKASSAISFSFEPNFRKIHEIRFMYPEDMRIIFKQMPFQSFYKSYIDNDYIKNRDYYDNILLKNGLDWFADFVYQLRNALFHEIIDPLDKEWQLIYKNAYLILKEVLGPATDYSIQKEVYTYIEKAFFDTKNQDFLEGIKESAEFEVFILNDYDLIDEDIEIEKIEVQDIVLHEDCFDSVDQQCAKFRCVANLSIDGRARVFDYNQSMYDKEDDKYYYIIHDEVKFKNAEAKIEIETEIEYDLRDIAKTINIIEINIKNRFITVELSNDERDNEWESIFPYEDEAV